LAKGQRAKGPKAKGSAWAKGQPEPTGWRIRPKWQSALPPSQIPALRRGSRFADGESLVPARQCAYFATLRDSSPPPTTPQPRLRPLDQMSSIPKMSDPCPCHSASAASPETPSSPWKSTGGDSPHLRDTQGLPGRDATPIPPLPVEEACVETQNCPKWQARLPLWTNSPTGRFRLTPSPFALRGGRVRLPIWLAFPAPKLLKRIRRLPVEEVVVCGRQGEAEAGRTPRRPPPIRPGSGRAPPRRFNVRIAFPVPGPRRLEAPPPTKAAPAVCYGPSMLSNHANASSCIAGLKMCGRS
jgi:hypothetical protein